jgi:hypothetical protein
MDLFNSILFCIQGELILDYYDKQLYWSVPILLRFYTILFIDV